METVLEPVENVYKAITEQRWARVRPDARAHGR